MDAEARKKELRGLDGAALSKLAYDLGLAPEGAYLWTGDVPYANRDFWEPHRDIVAASALFIALRRRGYTTSCCWFGDDRQYGDAWVGGIGDWCGAYGVRWPLDVQTEAMALLMVSVLAVEGERAAAARAQLPVPEGEESLC